MASCINAVEAAFRARGAGSQTTSAVSGVPLAGGKLHAKLATLDLNRRYAVAKVNANLPANPAERGLPSIQGVVILFDATTGTPLAAIDSASLTAIRTAAASAVAAKWLALRSASALAIIGCGAQAYAHLEALLQVRSVEQLRIYDRNRTAAEHFCRQAEKLSQLQCEVTEDIRSATLVSQIVATLTPSREAILGVADVSAGTFVAAVGADSEDKQEISVELLSAAKIIVDDLDQCAKIGDLHHAIGAGELGTADVRASLDQIVSERVAGRTNDTDIIVFDSTGVAIEDAAAAAIVYEKAEQSNAGALVDFGALPSRSVSGRSSS